MEILELSEGLFLTQLKKKHYHNLFPIYSDYEAIKYTDNRLHASCFDTLNHISKILRKKEENIYWVISLNNPSNVIGIAGIYHIDRFHKFGSLQFILARQYWNNGIITNVLKTIINYAFETEGLHRIEAQCFIKNYPAIRVFNKLDFIKEGELFENFLIEGKFENSYLYSKITKVKSS